MEITWSATNGGVVIEEVDHGSGAAGSSLTASTIHIRHNGENDIRNCKIFLGEKSDTYTGDATATQDMTELLAWGDAMVAASFGGIQLNFDAEGGFPESAWGTVTNKDPTNGKTVRTGTGDSATNGLILPVVTGCSTAGQVPTGDAPNVRFQVRAKIPTSESVLGERQFDLKLRYTFTS